VYRFFHSIAVLILILFCHPFLSFPATASEKSSSDAEEEQVKTLDEYFVSSSRLYDPHLTPTQMPTNAAVLTQKDIRETGAKTTQDILQYQRGIQVFDQIGNAFEQTVTIRGFTSDVNPTTVVVDGVRLNTPLSNQARYDLIPFQAIERIEVVPGSSSIFGKNALAGLVKVVTKRGGKETKVEANTSWGSFGRQRYRGNIGGSEGPFDYFFAVGKQLLQDGYRDDSDADLTQAFAKFGLIPNDRIDMSITLTHANNRIKQAGSISAAQLQADRRQNATPGDEQKNEINKVTFDIRGQVNPNLSIAFNGFYFHQSDHNKLIGLGSNSNAVNDFHIGGFVLQATQNTKIFGHRVVLVGGGEYSRNNFNRKGVSSFGMLSFLENLDSGENVYALFSQGSVEVFPSVTVTGGVRSDWDTLDFQDFVTTASRGKKKYNRVTTRAGITYQPFTMVSLFFSFSEGFRIPTQSELFSATLFGGNPNLKPIKSKNYEVGGRFKTPHFEGEISLYQIDIADDIQNFCDGPPFCTPSTNRNVEKTRHRGIETALRVFPNDLIDGYINYTFTGARFESSFVTGGPTSSANQTVDPGDSLPMVPKNHIAFGINLHPIEGLTTSLNGNYISTRFFFGDQSNSQKRLPGYVVLGFKTAYEKFVKIGIMEAFFQVDNILDTEYESSGRFVGLPTPFFTPAPGISVFGGIGFRL